MFFFPVWHIARREYYFCISPPTFFFPYSTPLSLPSEPVHTQHHITGSSSAPRSRAVPERERESRGHTHSSVAVTEMNFTVTCNLAIQALLEC